jgi:hypothetical protein
MAARTSAPPITLHLGAHRTATTSLQRLLDRNVAQLRGEGVALWTPQVTRGGLLRGVAGDPGRTEGGRDVQADRAAGRVAMHRAGLLADGARRLLVSDENLLGGLRENVMLGRLYPSVSARLHRLRAALPGVDRVCLAIRSPDAWWTSVFAFLIARGFSPPPDETLEAVQQASRGWRQVIEDVAAAFPAATVEVWSHEERSADQSGLFAFLTGVAPAHAGVPVLNPSLPASTLAARLREEGWTGQLPRLGEIYAPFDPDARAGLRAGHEEDLAWLIAGADGIARYHGARAAGSPPGRRGRYHARRRRASPS